MRVVRSSVSRRIGILLEISPFMDSGLKPSAACPEHIFAWPNLNQSFVRSRWESVLRSSGASAIEHRAPKVYHASVSLKYTLG